MGLTVAATFTYGSSTVDFYDDEIREIHIENRQKIDLFYLDDNLAKMYYIGEPYKFFRVIFRQERSTTIDRIETIQNQVNSYKQPEVLLFYYKKLIDSTVFVPVQMIRDEMVWPYYAGRKDKEQILILTFIETLNPYVGIEYAIQPNTFGSIGINIGLEQRFQVNTFMVP